MSDAPTFGGKPRADLVAVGDSGYYEDPAGRLYTADGPPASSNGTSPHRNRYVGRVLDVAALLAAPDEPTPWRCDGLAADGFLTVIAGRGGEGKSWLTLALACGVANGDAAAGIRCKRGRAILFDAENGAKLIARRLRAARVTADLAVQPVDVGGLSFANDAAWFRKVIEEHKPQLVVFDSLRVLSSGAKESDSDEMEPIVTKLKQLARDTGCAIVLVHHRGKAEGSDYRGSSVILDQTDMLFTLGRVAGDPEGRHRRKLQTVKCRIDEEPAPRWLAIVADRAQGLVTVGEAEPYDGESARPRDTLRDDVLAQLTGISQSGARIARALGRGKADGTVRRVLDDLQAEGLAEKRADGWGLPVATPLGVGNPGNPPEVPVDADDQGLPTLPTPTALATGNAPCNLVEATAYIHAMAQRGAAPGDFGPEQDALPAERCSCLRPLPAPDGDGDLRCAGCGRACDGWHGAA